MIDLPPPALICTVSAVSDADTIRCTDGTRIRIAGVSALEKNGSCNSKPDCPTMRHAQAKPIAERLVLNKRLVCRKMGVSYNRTVASCTIPGGRDLRCALNATGATVDWPRYVTQYGLRRCK